MGETGWNRSTAMVGGTMMDLAMKRHERSVYRRRTHMGGQNRRPFQRLEGREQGEEDVGVATPVGNEQNVGRKVVGSHEDDNTLAYIV